MLLRFVSWSAAYVWSLEWYSCFGACSGIQVFDLGVVIRLRSLEWYSSFGAWSGAQVLELVVAFRFWSGA